MKSTETHVHLLFPAFCKRAGFAAGAYKKANGDALGVTAPIVDQAWARVQGLRHLDPKIWGGILKDAVPAAAIGAGGAYALHRLFADKPKTWEEEEKRRRRSRNWALFGGALAGLGAANTTWRHKLNPAVGANIWSSLLAPVSSTAAGLARNSQRNQMRAADAAHQNAILPKRMLDTALDVTRYPVVGNWKLWLPAMLDSRQEARVGRGSDLPTITKEDYERYLMS